MAVAAGRVVLIKVGTEDPAVLPSASWDTIGQQRGGSFGRSVETADATHKDDNGWASAIGTRKAWTVSCEGALDQADAAWGRLKAAHSGLGRIAVQIDASAMTSGEKVEGLAWLTDLTYEFPESDVVTFTAEFQGDGVLQASA